MKTILFVVAGISGLFALWTYNSPTDWEQFAAKDPSRNIQDSGQRDESNRMRLAGIAVRFAQSHFLLGALCKKAASSFREV
jgi:hypothetical protein